MFDNPIIAEIKRDIISSLPKGANLNELNIMDLWVKNRGGKTASLQIKNETYDIKLSANSMSLVCQRLYIHGECNLHSTTL